MPTAHKTKQKRLVSVRSQLKSSVLLLKKLFAIRIVRITSYVLLVTLLSPLILFFILRPHVSNDITYGTTFSHKYATELGLDWKETYIAILDDLGVKNLRLVAYWEDSEPNRDEYDFSIIKWQLDEAKKRDIPVILITGRKQVRYPECFEPTWWEEIKEEAARDSEVYEFVKQTVIELKDYENIAMWQVENEPFFPFGDCAGDIKWSVLQNEISIVRELDDRPVLVQDSGEGGVWLPTYLSGDYLGVSMYRRIWYDFWGVFLGRSIYFQYPLAHWTYKIKADLVGVPYQKVIVTELQAEPWGPGPNVALSKEEADKTMSRELFIDTLNYAQKSGFSDLYFWGSEWWYFQKQIHNEPFYWDTIKATLN